MGFVCLDASVKHWVTFALGTHWEKKTELCNYVCGRLAAVMSKVLKDDVYRNCLVFAPGITPQCALCARHCISVPCG